MAETIWQTGKLYFVLEPVGTDANGEKRYQRAGYDVLLWSPTSGGQLERYMVPVSIENVTGLGVNDTGKTWQWRNEFGAYSSSPIIRESHDTDGWNELHYIGLI